MAQGRRDVPSPALMRHGLRGGPSRRSLRQDPRRWPENLDPSLIDDHVVAIYYSPIINQSIDYSWLLVHGSRLKFMAHGQGWPAQPWGQRKRRAWARTCGHSPTPQGQTGPVGHVP